MMNLPASCASPIRDGWRFLKGALANPARIGAVVPSGVQLARAMAAQVPLQSALPVLELGPGTGSITRALVERLADPARLVLVEFDAGFHSRLAARFPGTRILRGDAFELRDALVDGAPTRYCAIVSGLPLLNFPAAKRQKLLADCFALLEEGGVFVQFSYGRKPPVPPVSGFWQVSSGDWLAMNMPPARVHVYRRCTAPAAGMAL
jgi:phosphatidylethanolamine/phosphatidyl-N-methylethanolamine N-methyltransferase